MKFNLPSFIVRVADRGKKKKIFIPPSIPEKVIVTSSTTHQGYPVSDCATINLGEEWTIRVQNALAHVDAVIGAPSPLWSIPIVVDKMENELAAYDYNKQTMEPVQFVIHRANKQLEMSLAHEIGHHIDLWGLGRPGRWASSDPLLQGWRDAIDDSDETKILTASLKTNHVSVIESNKVKNVPISKKYVEFYLLSQKEQFARAFAQYVAVKTQSPKMLAQLDKMRANHLQYGTRQWSDKNFEPIEASLDTLLKQEGWIL